MTETNTKKRDILPPNEGNSLRNSSKKHCFQLIPCHIALSCFEVYLYLTENWKGLKSVARPLKWSLSNIALWHSNTFLIANPTISPNLKRTISLQDQNSLYWKSCVCIVSHLCSLDSLFLVLLLTLLVQSSYAFPAQSNCTDDKIRAERIARILSKETDDLLKNYVSTCLMIFSQPESVFEFECDDSGFECERKMCSMSTLWMSLILENINSAYCPHILPYRCRFTEHFVLQPITVKYESHPEYYYYYLIIILLSVCNAALDHDNWTR